MVELTASQFSDFYRAIHGTNHDPYPWQSRLATRVIEGIGWPPSISIPTGCGKTSCIDIAVYALACNPQNNPRRIVFTVNRRVVVDGAHERARLIASRLKGASGGILCEVRDRLRDMAGGSHNALKPVLLRGGMHIEKGWGANPAQPCIISATVDQVGSRLLFRGYGVGRMTRGVEAGLLGNDCLWILDETHISRPFTETLKAVQKYHRVPWSRKKLSRPWCVVEMTATPHGNREQGFELDEKDLDPNGAIYPKLSARKICDLVKSKAKDSGDYKLLAKDLEKQARTIHKKFGCSAIAVVANRVATAKIVHRLLKDAGFDTYLLIGRMRPWDRDIILSHLDRFRTSSGAEAHDSRRPDHTSLEPQPPTFVVSTQCLEVGADLDFDGMVSEASSLDSLRQRFGRLNRSGMRDRCRGAVVAPVDVHSKKGKMKADVADPIYGEAVVKTWMFLARDERTSVDFGISAMSADLKKTCELHGTPPNEMVMHSAEYPRLLPQHVDLLCQTHQHLHTDLNIAPFLHGFERGMPMVSAVWRSGLRSEDLDDVLDALPPRSSESMPVPLWTIRKYLQGYKVGLDTGGDAEWQKSGSSRHEGASEPARLPPLAFLWRGKADGYARIVVGRSEESAAHTRPGDRTEKKQEKTIHISKIRPGDTVILSVEDGGWDELGHIPNAPKGDNKGTSNVMFDIAEKVAFISTKNVTIRMHNNHVYPFQTTEDVSKFITSIKNERPAPVLSEIRNKIIEKLPEMASLIGDKDVLSELAQGASICNVEIMGGGGFLLTVKKIEKNIHVGDGLLDTHMKNVAYAVKKYAKSLGLDDDGLLDLLEKAALLHDAGKSDRRFQQMLYRSLLPGSDLRAKDNGQPRGKRVYYPRGFRHELVSSRLAETVDVTNQDLFLHLIESHHGHCRPYVPPVADRGDVMAEYEFEGQTLRTASLTGLEKIGSGPASRFWTCVREYGWWGLAWLEALLALADWEASGGSS